MLLDFSKHLIIFSTNDKSAFGIFNITLTGTPIYPSSGAVSKQSFLVEMNNLCVRAFFYDKNIPNLVINRQSAEYYQAQKLVFGEFNYYPLDPAGISCGKVTHELYLSKTKIAPPYWVELSGLQIWVDPSKMDDDKTLKVTNSEKNLSLDLVIAFEDYPQIEMTKQLNVTINDF